MEKANIFVYGSLREDLNPMRNLLLRHGKILGTATIQAKLYDLGQYPGAVTSPANTDRIFGEVFEIQQADHVFAVLDSYEGQHFKREEITLTLDDGPTMRCWAYFYTGSLMRKALIASGDYIKYRNS